MYLILTLSAVVIRTVAGEEECSSTPFCGLLQDCCSAHAECYSMCCSSDGACIEPKFCYSTDKLSDTKLIEQLPTTLLTPSVNSTSKPYFYPDNVEDCQIPCFTYVYKTKIGKLDKASSTYSISTT